MYPSTFFTLLTFDGVTFVPGSTATVEAGNLYPANQCPTLPITMFSPPFVSSAYVTLVASLIIEFLVAFFPYNLPTYSSKLL